MRAIVLFLSFLAACDQGKARAMEKTPDTKRTPADAAVATTEDCTQLLAHLIDLEFASASTAATTETMRAEIAKQKSSVSDARRDEFVRACVAMPRDRVTCALAASDQTAVAKCDEPPTHSR
jgi:hypothetical protein